MTTNTKNNFLIILMVLAFTFNADGQETKFQWSKEKAKQWQKDDPWYCGFNYIPAYAINYTAMWDKTTWRLYTILSEGNRGY